MKSKFLPLHFDYQIADEDMIAKSKEFRDLMSTRRSIRHFSTRAIPIGVLENCIRTAGTAPSGANQQPWHFCVVQDTDLKHRIREAAEAEERAFYAGKAGEVWLDTLIPLGTNADKPFLEDAPMLIAIFEQKYHLSEAGERIKHYYSKESTGIATGLLITAIHNAGLVSLTHTPSPMNFLSRILKRPDGERPFLLLVVGYPAENARVPNISKKPLSEISTWL